MNKEYSKLDTLRHSAAHVLAHAVKSFFPKAKFGVGPPIENGFYYDIDVEGKLTEEDLPKIEKRMGEIIKADKPFEKKELSRDEAKKFFSKPKDPYKLEIIDQIGAEDKISIFTEGGFTDLCRGPHVKSAGEIKAFKLMRLSGAYWRGSENNPMMQRVYGTAFFSDKDLKKFLHVQEEAKKRDHRKLGRELDLYSVHEEAGPGLVFYHPKGGILRYLIEQYIREEHLKRGYQFVAGPQILKSDVWKISGHYSYYKENMFIYQTSDKKEYAVKPMNCPGHMLIYRTKARSWRDLPLKFFELGNVCRNEKSGVLHGLLRVRNFTQDDAHVFCLPDQLEGEIQAILEFVFDVLKTFGFKEFEIDLSTRPKDSIGSDEMWQKATEALENALKKKNLKFNVAPGGGAFYGPKIDVNIKDALGRSWQCSTVQCDFALPEAFELEYTAPTGSKEKPVMVHRALLGSVERFMGTLIEHYAGAFPFWLSPIQVVFVPISKKHEAYASGLKAELDAKGLRSELLDSSDTLGRRIRLAQTEKVPYTLVMGDKELDGRLVTVRERISKDQKTLPWGDFLRACDDNVRTKEDSIFRQ